MRHGQYAVKYTQHFTQPPVVAICHQCSQILAVGFASSSSNSIAFNFNQQDTQQPPV